MGESARPCRRRALGSVFLLFVAGGIAAAYFGVSMICVSATVRRLCFGNLGEECWTPTFAVSFSLLPPCAASCYFFLQFLITVRPMCGPLDDHRIGVAWRTTE